MRVRGLFLSLCSSLLLLWPVAGTAQDAEAAAEFERLIAEGAEHMDAGRYADARESLLNAEEIFQHPSLSLRIAIAEAQMGRCADALARHSTLENMELPESVAAGLPGLGDSVDACDPRGRLQLTCEPADAQVTIGDAEVPCGEEVEFAAGEHRLFADHPRFVSRSQRVEIQEGERTEANLQLSPLPEPTVAWQTPAGFTALGLGAALLTTGVVVDAGAPGRQEEIQAAAAANDFDRVANLEDLAQTRRRQSAILLISGAAVTATGGLLVWRGRRDAALAVHPTPGGVVVRAEF
jgi:hypothetical protein